MGKSEAIRKLDKAAELLDQATQELETDEEPENEPEDVEPDVPEEEPESESESIRDRVGGAASTAKEKLPVPAPMALAGLGMIVALAGFGALKALKGGGEIADEE